MLSHTTLRFFFAYYYKSCSLSINVHTKIFPCACIDLDIPKDGKVKEKEELKKMLNWGKFFYGVISDRGIFTYLNNK